MQRPTYEDRYSVSRYLETILPLKDETGYCAYPEGVSDTTIAQEMGVAPNVVAYLRLKRHGKLRAPPTKDDGEERLRVLQAVVDHLAQEIDFLRSKREADDRRISSLAARVARLEVSSPVINTYVTSAPA